MPGFFKLSPKQHTSMERSLKAIAKLSEQGRELPPVTQFVDRRDVVSPQEGTSRCHLLRGRCSDLVPALFSHERGANASRRTRDRAVAAFSIRQRFSRSCGGRQICLYHPSRGRPSNGCLPGGMGHVRCANSGSRLPWLLTTVFAAASAAGLALAFVSACSTRQQAASLGNFLILVMSAIGGSMVPRFLMPEFFQQLGWLTPNTWVLEAYSVTFWRDDLTSLLIPIGALALTAVGGLWIAKTLTRRAMSH